MFRKEFSVFAPWKEDKADVIKIACNTDFEEWKADRVIKSESDVSRLIDMMTFDAVYCCYFIFEREHAFP